MWFILGFTTGSIAGISFSGGNVQYMVHNVVSVIQYTMTNIIGIWN